MIFYKKIDSGTIQLTDETEAVLKAFIKILGDSTPPAGHKIASSYFEVIN